MWPASESASRGRAGLSREAGMDYLPVFLRLRAQPVVVVGGGQVALRKALWLRRAGAHVTVVAPHLHPELGQRVVRGELTHVAAEFSSAQLVHAVAVVAATDDRAANAAVAAAARERRVPVNVVDDAELSSFIFPAIIDRSPIVVAVSSAGHSPVLARRVREQLEALLPERLGALARFMGARREALRRALAPRARRALWERVASGPVATHVLAGDEPRADRALARELLVSRLGASQAAVGESLGEVYLIGAGPGDPDLLTLRALQLLQRADVILYDRLVSEAVLERGRRAAPHPPPPREQCHPRERTRGGCRPVRLALLREPAPHGRRLHGCGTAAGHHRQTARRRSGPRTPGGHHRARDAARTADPARHAGRHHGAGRSAAGRTAGAPDRGRRGGF